MQFVSGHDKVITKLPDTCISLRWLVRHPTFRSGSVSTAFLREHAPLSAPPLRAAPAAFAHAWRLNTPAPPPRPAPDLTAVVPVGAALGKATITAPMPGTVLAVPVAAGDEVTAHDPLVVLEAMKMEMPVLAPFAATVTAVHVTAGEQVASGAVLVELG
jgi:biotin carboxyl carrier protein